MSNCKHCGKPMRFVHTWGRAPLYLNDWMCDECGLGDTLPEPDQAPSDDGEPMPPAPSEARLLEFIDVATSEQLSRLVSQLNDEDLAYGLELVKRLRRVLQGDAPSDDGEPITREWVICEYGNHTISVSSAIKVIFSEAQVPEVILSVSEGKDSRWAFLRHVETRGQLRQLLAALGWRRRGDHES